MINVHDLIPRNRSASGSPTVYRETDPFMALQREVNRLFDDMFRGFDAPGLGRLPAAATGWSAGWPNFEVSETEKELRVTAEMPGLEEKDVEVLLDDGMLTLRGEKKSETEDKGRQFSERFYGRFERQIALGPEVEQDNVAATFKNGVLTITLPKSERAQSKARRIAISTGK
jgi:HSP20 family protein